MRVLQGHLSREIGRRNIERPYVTELLRAFSMILHSPVSTHFIRPTRSETKWKVYCCYNSFTVHSA